MRARVYVVDRAELPSKSLAPMLSGAGYDPLFYPSAAAFFAAAGSPAPVLVAIADPDEPFADLRALLVLGWPLIALTPADDPALAARALGLGAADVLVAPFDRSELVLMLRSASALLPQEQHP